MTTKKGFTLVELLIAVSIIAVLTTISLVIYIDIQKGARDSRRKQDLRVMQTALTIYYQKNSRFPCSDAGGSGSAIWQKSSDSDPWFKDNTDCNLPSAPFDNKYLNSLPKDPKNTTGYPWASGEYSYAYWSGEVPQGAQTLGCPQNKAQYYILVTKLENKNDKERAAVKPYYFCNKLKDGGPDEIISHSELIPGEDIEDLFFVTSQD